MNESTTDFENIVLSELKRSWHSYVLKFKWNNSGITAPQFRITEAHVDHWAQWVPSKREMHFSRYLVTKRPWNEVLEVLKHEMAHQYVSEVLKVTGEAPHGSAFKAVCKQFNIDAAVTLEILGIPNTLSVICKPLTNRTNIDALPTNVFIRVSNSVMLKKSWVSNFGGFRS